jgi:hypothetical protein
LTNCTLSGNSASAGTVVECTGSGNSRRRTASSGTKARRSFPAPFGPP